MLFAKNYLLAMENNSEKIKVEDWISERISFGKYVFSREMLEAAFPSNSKFALKQSLNRLSRKGKIVSVHKDYYVIVSSEYASWGILPPALFIDSLMKYLNRPYYTGLLNAAAFYGAAHQSPQEFFVFTSFPAMRPAQKKGIRINYISKTKISENSLENKKTETGFLKVSSPELTAADIVQFHKRIGGLNRAVAVLEELAEAINIEKLNQEFLRETPTSVIQRLGYLLEMVVGLEEIPEKLYQCAQDLNINFFPVLLNSLEKSRGFSAVNRWKVIVNAEVELD